MMDLLEQINRTAFLGPEFLTWLWFRTETQGENFHVKGMEHPFEVWFDDRLVVGSTRVNAQENFFKGGHPSSSLEARTALRLGKLATQARLRIVRDSLEWGFVFNATELNCSGVKLPPVLAKETDEKLYERMYLVEQLDMMIKGLFGQFLQLRISEDWNARFLPEIHAWVGQQATETAKKPLVRRNQTRDAQSNSETIEHGLRDGNLDESGDDSVSPNGHKTEECTVSSGETAGIDMDDAPKSRNEDLPPWEDPIED